MKIESLALDLAIDQGDDKWEASIVGTLHTLVKWEEANYLTLESYPAWRERNEMFHSSMIAACNSPLLLKIRNSLVEQFDRYIILSFSKTKSRVPLDDHGHRALAEAVLKRDKKKARLLMEAHIMGGLDTVISILHNTLRIKLSLFSRCLDSTVTESRF